MWQTFILRKFLVVRFVLFLNRRWFWRSGAHLVSASSLLCWLIGGDWWDWTFIGWVDIRWRLRSNHRWSSTTVGGWRQLLRGFAVDHRCRRWNEDGQWCDGSQLRFFVDQGSSATKERTEMRWRIGQWHRTDLKEKENGEREKTIDDRYLFSGWTSGNWVNSCSISVKVRSGRLASRTGSGSFYSNEERRQWMDLCRERKIYLRERKLVGLSRPVKD